MGPHDAQNNLIQTQGPTGNFVRELRLPYFPQFADRHQNPCWRKTRQGMDRHRPRSRPTLGVTCGTRKGRILRTGGGNNSQVHRGLVAGDNREGDSGVGESLEIALTLLDGMGGVMCMSNAKKLCGLVAPGSNFRMNTVAKAGCGCSEKREHQNGNSGCLWTTAMASPRSRRKRRITSSTGCETRETRSRTVASFLNRGPRALGNTFLLMLRSAPLKSFNRGRRRFQIPPPLLRVSPGRCSLVCLNSLHPWIQRMVGLPPFLALREAYRLMLSPHSMDSRLLSGLFA